MNNLIISNNEELTMSSLEISELVSSRHDNVKRTIARLSWRHVICYPPTEDVKNNKGQLVTVYKINKRDSYIIVAQLSPEFTAKLVDRWQELENNQAYQIPTNYAEALQLAADQAVMIDKQSEALKLAAPKAEFVDRFVASEGNKTFREVAKILKANERDLREFLVKSKIMYKLNGEWAAFGNHIDAKRFYTTTGEKNGHAYTDCKFTPKGVEYVAGKWVARLIKKEGE